MKTTMGAMAVLAALLAGCTVQTPGTGASPNGGGSSGSSGSSGGGAASAPGVTCSAIVDCAGKCADGDNACIDACIAKGSPDAQARANALKSCIETNMCADSTCLQQHCSSEIASCVQTTSSGTPAAPGATPTTGSVPSELVGTWQNNTTLIAFTADGKVHRQSSVTTGTCHSGSSEDGVAVASGDSLTLSFTSGQFLICDQDNGKPYAPKTEQYTWSVTTQQGASIMGNYQLLTLVDKNCTQSDPSACNYAYDQTN